MMKISMAALKGKAMRKVAGGLCVAMAGTFAMSPMTAFAQSKEVECTCEVKCEKNSINEECGVCSYDYTFCEGEEVKEEEPTEVPMGPLTPDGNLDLVDDYGSLELGGKQFITVVTKSGNYFYIIIDRDDKGTETVHFLNMVDESDLLALMDDEQVEEYISKTGTGDKEETVVTDPTIPEETEPTDVPEEPQKEKPKGNTAVLGLVGLVALSGAGGVMFFKKSKKKKPVSSGIDPDADYDEDEDDYLASLPSDEDEDIDIDETDVDDPEKYDSTEDESDDEDSKDEQKLMGGQQWSPFRLEENKWVEKTIYSEYAKSVVEITEKKTEKVVVKGSIKNRLDALKNKQKKGVN